MKSIVAQLDAFRKDDYGNAVKYQSTMLRGNFPNVDVFRAMMNRSYPQFAHYKSVRFGPSRTETHSSVVQIVAHVVGEDNVKVTGVYMMKIEDGIYRVLGVQGGVAQFAPATNDVRSS
jgi:hypothetical protein